MAYLFHEFLDDPRIMHLFTGKDMKYRPTGVFRLDIVLKVQGLENIVGIVHRKLG